MKIISLGNACVTRYRIDELNLKRGIGRSTTGFFDWVRTINFSRLLDVLTCKSIDDVLIITSITFDEEKQKMNVHFNEMIATHDLHKGYTDEDVTNFKLKYKRRYGRLIETIKSDEELVFIRFGETFNEEKVKKFESAITNINPGCKYRLISVMSHGEITEALHSATFIEKHIKDYPRMESDGAEDWAYPFVDWTKLFKDVNLL